MSRGNRRNAIFKEKYDYVTFLEYIELVQGLFPFKLHSVCLMTNHFHMTIIYLPLRKVSRPPKSSKPLYCSESTSSRATIPLVHHPR